MRHRAGVLYSLRQAGRQFGVTADQATQSGAYADTLAHTVPTDEIRADLAEVMARWQFLSAEIQANILAFNLGPVWADSSAAC
jgi:hypothetical protein